MKSWSSSVGQVKGKKEQTENFKEKNKHIVFFNIERSGKVVPL